MHDPGRAATPAARIVRLDGCRRFRPLAQLFPLQLLDVFGRTADGPLRAAAVVWNVALFSGFAAHHSVFAREPVRRLLTRTFPISSGRSTSGSRACCSSPCAGCGSRSPATIWELDGAARIAAAVLHIGGIVFSVYSAVTHRCLRARRHTAAQRPTPDAQLPTTPNSQRPMPNSHGEEFKTTGPYGWVRHPIYLGGF